MPTKRNELTADDLWDSSHQVGSTFRSASAPGVYYLLSNRRRLYGARSIEFNEVRRGRRTKVTVSAAALEGRGIFPLVPVYDAKEAEMESQSYHRGVPIRVHLITQHVKETKAPALADGVL